MKKENLSQIITGGSTLFKIAKISDKAGAEKTIQNIDKQFSGRPRLSSLGQKLPLRIILSTEFVLGIILLQKLYFSIEITGKETCSLLHNTTLIRRSFYSFYSVIDYTATFLWLIQHQLYDMLVILFMT